MPNRTTVCLRGFLPVAGKLGARVAWAWRVVLCSCVFLGGVGAKAEEAPKRTLRTAREAHDLSTEDAVRGYPVLLRGVVTYCNPNHRSLFVHDASGDVYVLMPVGADRLEPGTLVEVKGISALGQFAPIVNQLELHVLGMAHLPTRAPRVSLLRMMTGAEDGQWVEVEGVVRRSHQGDDEVAFVLTTLDGTFTANTWRLPGVDYERFVDAHIQVHGNVVPEFNADRQMTGARLIFPDLSTVKVLDPAPADPFALPIVPIDSLARFQKGMVWQRRIHLRGRVTLVWPNDMVCIQDAARALCAQTTDDAGLRLGMVADLVGFPAYGESAPILTDAMARGVTGEEAHPVGAVWIDSVPAMKNDAEVIMMDGELVGRDPASSDMTLMLLSKGKMYAAVLPSALAGEAAARWKPGSRLRVTGVCSVQVDREYSSRLEGVPVPKAFRILLRSPADIVVVTKPTWWSPHHSLLVVGGFFMLTSLVLVWVAALRRTVERQTKTIRESELRFKHMAEHDSLTGLPTRALLHERLCEGLERCRRDGTGLALLMVDLDHFKSINDTYGHTAGDMALKVTAERMLSAVGEADTVARMGGDEFLVLLTNLREVRRAEGIAAELVRVVSRPFLFEEQQVPITASVGVCASLSGQFDAEGLLKDVDAAMYRAKSQGRNRFQMAGPLVMAGAPG